MVCDPTRIKASLTEEEVPRLTQQQVLHTPEGWCQLEFNDRVFIMLPLDMQSEKLFGDSVRYREIYGNGKLSVIFVGDLITPVNPDELRKNKVFSCNLGEHPKAENLCFFRLRSRPQLMAKVLGASGFEPLASRSRNLQPNSAPVTL